MKSWSMSRATRSLPIGRRGMTLVELLVVLGIIGVLLLLALPAIQSIRELARNATCRNNLRQIGLAVANFEAARESLPVGTLGFGGSYIVSGTQYSNWLEPASSGYWRNMQHTSSLFQLAPWIGLQSLFDSAERVLANEQTTYAEFRGGNPGTPDWIGELPGVRRGLFTVVPDFLCPSDSLESAKSQGALAFIASQPAFATDVSMDGLLGMVTAWELEQPAGTNYLANAGAHSAGVPSSFRPDGYTGPFRSRRAVQLAAIRDGQSNTVLYGESLGGIQNKRRTHFHSWMLGGLARGRGGLPWMSDYDPSLPELLLFGDSQWAHPGGFGSMHPSVVNFVLVDGAVRSLSRGMDFMALYGMCGISDGMTFNQD